MLTYPIILLLRRTTAFLTLQITRLQITRLLNYPIPPEALMDRVRFIDHGGHRILLLDYSNCKSAAEMLKMIEIRKAISKAQRPASLLTLTDATGAKFSHDVLTKIKEAAALERPVIKRAAVVGID